MMIHPRTQTLGAWADGALAGRRGDGVARHVAACPACRRKVRTLELAAQALRPRRVDRDRLTGAVIDALASRPTAAPRHPVAEVVAVHGTACAQSDRPGSGQGFDLFPGCGVFASDRLELDAGAWIELAWTDGGGQTRVCRSGAVGDLIRRREAPSVRRWLVWGPATAWAGAAALVVVALATAFLVAPLLRNADRASQGGTQVADGGDAETPLSDVAMAVDHSLVVSVPFESDGLIAFPGGSARSLADGPGLFMGTPRDVAASEAAAQRRELTDLRRRMTGQGYHEVTIDLPPPRYVCMPRAIRLPNLERPYFRKQPPLFTPRKATNVALGKPVTTSGRAPVQGDLAMITDGRKEGFEGAYVELGPGPQYVQIDLGERHYIYAVAVWHYYQDHRAYKSVVVMTADDPDFSDNVTVIYNADYDNALGLGEGSDKTWVQSHHGRLMVPPDGASVGRYVRLYSDGSTSGDTNEYIEVEVYGAPVERPAP